MDLSSLVFRPAESVIDWASLIVVADARQAASPTALAQARLDAPETRPGGAFARSVAAHLARGQE